MIPVTPDHGGGIVQLYELISIEYIYICLYILVKIS